MKTLRRPPKRATTQKETEVVRLYERGLSEEEIVAILAVSPATVYSRLRSAYHLAGGPLYMRLCFEPLGTVKE
jgi:DNA-binding CsgD family transcriptional regulator